MKAELVIAALCALAGCGGDEESVGETGARETTTGFAAAGCPIDDPELCVRAAAAATALQRGDTGRLVELSYADAFVCEDLPVVGVGTCGPDDPDRRSYHLAFWTASRDEGGSLELVRRQSEWSIGIVYADSLANWKSVYDDPETELACGNVQPWN